MTDPARPDPMASLPVPVPPAPVAGGGSTSTHGFLFADLRDYTRYVDTHGDVAGAALLERYRLLVRDAVATAHGAEIRTEGDSFYVVFDSVSAAVRCGLAILAGAAASADGAVEPIRVGVGIHAGETVETPEGFVGSVVNIAARLCAEARSGELVVSETVRGLVRTQVEVEFQPLGARRLKGVAEPVPCYRVVPRRVAAGTGPASTSATSHRTRLPAAIVGAAALAVAVLALGYAALSALPSAPPSAPPAGMAASPDPSGSTLASVGPGGPSPQASPAIPAPSPTLGPFPTEADRAILAALPDAVAQTCRRGGTPDDARLAGFVGTYHTEETAGAPALDWPVTPRVLAGITCHPRTGADRLYVAELDRPAGWGPSASSWADEYIIRLTGRWAIPLGSCASPAKAYERWRTTSGTGLVACMNTYDGRPWIYFTFGAGTYLAFATRDDADYDALYAWWEQLKTFLP